MIPEDIVSAAGLPAPRAGSPAVSVQKTDNAPCAATEQTSAAAQSIAPAPRNRTLTVTKEEKLLYLSRTITLTKNASPAFLENKTIHAALEDTLPFLPEGFIDLLIIDPPYNLTKNFNGTIFRKTGTAEYMQWLESWFPRLLPCLTDTASVYICGDWQSGAALYTILEKYLIVRNRITWQREKGRGAQANWKNTHEDVWFATKGKDYHFDVESVKLKRKVIAPYRTKNGKPKDWKETADGKFRLTCPGNFMDDITIPYWSMPENTEHPTQKPEKLIAKLILASSQPTDMVFDPFLGSGTTSVTAKKLGRRYCGIEQNGEYCALAEKRLFLASAGSPIQGYRGGVFWERNSQPQKGKKE